MYVAAHHFEYCQDPGDEVAEDTRSPYSSFFLIVSSYTDVTWACHVFLVFLTSPKSVYVGHYSFTI